MCLHSHGQRLGAVLWSSACSAPFFRSKINHHHYGCQTLHPPGWEPHRLVPKLAEIGAGGITLCLWTEECPNRSCHLAGAHPLPASSPWLQASLPGKLSSSTQSASCCRASITQIPFITLEGDKSSPVDEPQPQREQTYLQKEISLGERSRRKRGNSRESTNISSHSGARFFYFSGFSLAPSHCG